MPEQLYCSGKVIFLYNDLTPPAKQVGFGFWHFHFSEHEKLQCPQQAKAHTKKYDKYGISAVFIVSINYCGRWDLNLVQRKNALKKGVSRCRLPKEPHREPLFIIISFFNLPNLRTMGVTPTLRIP